MNPSADESYSLTLVLYHSLEGAHAAERALREAEAWSDAGLVAFFDRVHATNLQLADEAKDLLRQHLVGREGDEFSPTQSRTAASRSRVDEASMESFPASDAPGY